MPWLTMSSAPVVAESLEQHLRARFPDTTDPEDTLWEVKSWLDAIEQPHACSPHGKLEHYNAGLLIGRHARTLLEGVGEETFTLEQFAALCEPPLDGLPDQTFVIRSDCY